MLAFESLPNPGHSKEWNIRANSVNMIWLGVKDTSPDNFGTLMFITLSASNSNHSSREEGWAVRRPQTSCKQAVLTCDLCVGKTILPEWSRPR